MTIFLIFGPVVLLVSAGLAIYNKDLKSPDLWHPFVRGLIAAVAGAVLLLIYNSGAQRIYTAGSFYFDSLLFYFLIPMAVAQLGSFFFEKVFHIDNEGNKEFGYLSYLTGFFFFLSIVTVLLKNNKLDPFILFYLPFANIAMILLLSSLSLYIQENTINILKYILYFSSVLISFIFAMVPLFYYVNIDIASILLAVLIFGGSIWAFIFLRNRY